MDGISAGASIIGVISLAMQLSSAAWTVARLLDTITDAPSEVVRLKDLLDLVHVTSIGVRNALQCQRRLHGDTIPGTEHIRNALAVCQRKLALIQSVLNRVENVERGRTLVSRSWARFRLAVKKDEIAVLERQLGQALDVLNVLLTTNLM
jgi:hypothetical protein